MKYAMYIGRWQPFHKAHEWIVDQALSKGKNVLIAVRDIPPNPLNPLTTEATIEMIEMVYSDKLDRVKVISIPDIESINYGRDVGYEVNKLIVPYALSIVSATGIREDLYNGSDKWKESVNPRIHNFLEEKLRYC